MSILILLASVIGGIFLSAQSSINGAFSKKAGTFESTFITFITGAMILFIVILFAGNGDLLKILEAPKWQLSAVWFGVGYLFLTILAVPQIGVIAANISTVIGQLSMGMLIDHFGWFGGLQVSFDLKRLIAILLMLVALRLIYVGNMKAEREATTEVHE
ncbi:DMT family transporter [Bacillus sp. N1-1]|jgi:bacterial/archaeal transporter family-2 protein|uniref:DMT family transporter n=1 Tax=Bacillus sp. N1-1 TaxID=2682541 RepID=UPI001317BB53|nr:DMT family transporter [Bacillus sp. N1-1]QHA93980.1 EamA-like transporter family protein [Bacillus sp. N1-1]